MTENGNQVLRRYLEDAVSAGQALEAKLHDFGSAVKEDDEVQALFEEHASEIRAGYERLAERLEALGGTTGRSKLPLTSPVEERSLTDLMASYASQTGLLAFYEVLATFARAANDPDMEKLARELQNEGAKMAEKIWHFLPSRSKIAFNMLTVSEVDPAVETKLADDRLGS